MRVLLINKFLYQKGGDAIATLATGDLLRSRGHEVIFWGMRHPSNPPYPNEDLFIDNLDLNNAGGIVKQLDIAGKLLYSFEAKNKIKALIERVGKPDIVHLHNFAHQISPSILDVFKQYRIPVVMTMHDYKLVCAAYTFLSHGKLCEKCVGGKYYHCFQEGCVKDSKAKSLLNMIEMYLHHSFWHIYGHVGMFIAPSRFLKSKLVDMGFTGKIVHLSNFIHSDLFEPRYENSSHSIVFCGRLSSEKGVVTLIEAVTGLDVTLRIIGDGPIKVKLEELVRAAGIKNVVFAGYKTGNALKDELSNSMFTVIPSEWYENNPLSVIEAFALGKPVIGARIGGIPELVKEGETGYTFEPFSTADLRDKIVRLSNDVIGVERMGRNARRFVETELSARKHYEGLMAVYEETIRHSRK